MQSNQFVVKQKMYEDVKERVEHVVSTGKVDRYQFREVFDLWDHKFTSQDHPSIIKVKFNKSLYICLYFETKVYTIRPHFSSNSWVGATK